MDSETDDINYEFNHSIRYIDLLGSQLYQITRAVSKNEEIIYRDLKPTFSFMRREYNSDTFGLATGISIETPSHLQQVDVTHYIWIVNPKDAKKRKLLHNNSYSYGGRYGAGSFSLSSESSSQIIFPEIESTYVDQYGNVRFLIQIKVTRYDVKREYIFQKLSEILNPEQFSGFYKTLTAEIDLARAKNVKLTEEIRQVEEQMKNLQTQVDEYMENEFKVVSQKHTVIEEVNSRMRSRIQAMKERLFEMQEHLDDHNLHHFLKTLDPKNYPISHMTAEQILEFNHRLIKLQRKVQERIIDEESCICLENTRRSQVLQPCGHRYCQDCVSQNTNQLCPVCMEPYLTVITIKT